MKLILCISVYFRAMDKGIILSKGLQNFFLTNTGTNVPGSEVLHF